jgi:hypothetical protein
MRRIPLVTRAVEHLIVRELRSAFHALRRIGTGLDVPPRPLVLYANHHSVHDGYALWYLATRVLGRRASVWMADWERFPFFSAAGARPFPDDDLAIRMRTLRSTRAALAADPLSTLIYFPEGRMHPAEEGLLPWPVDTIPRLDRFLGGCTWLPVALYSSWRQSDRPELFLLAGEPRSATSDTRHRLQILLEDVPARSLESSEVILEGRHSTNQRDFSALAGFFRKRL